MLLGRNFDFWVGDKKMLINGGTVAPDFLKIFQYPLIKGNVNSVLSDAYSIVIDESTSKSLFGDDDPIGVHEADRSLRQGDV